MQSELDRFLDTSKIPNPTRLEIWFAHKHGSHPGLSLKEIAAQSGYSYGYVRRKHSQYLARLRTNR